MRTPSGRKLAGGGRLRGEIRVPGDKSISHRALMLGALAEGTTEILGLSPGDDVRSTRLVMEALGARIETTGDRVQVMGRGALGLSAPACDLDAGNSGTTMRLMAGILAGCAFESRLTGDASLTRRPMARLASALRPLGARIVLSAGGTAPVTVLGSSLIGTTVALGSPSAQVKSAVLLAGLRASGRTTVVEPAATRDHTEKLLQLFGVPVHRDGLSLSVEGRARPRAARVEVPGDPSSAAFWVVATSLAPGSELRMPGVAADPSRTRFLDVLERMGANILRRCGPHGAGTFDLEVRSAALRATEVSAAEIPSLVDEVPILAVAAARAHGLSRICGLGELRHKESDRLAGISALLTAFGAETRIVGDDLLIEGPARLRAAEADSQGDHRLAMAAGIAGFLAEGETTLSGADCASVSYPSFFHELEAARRA